MDEATIPKEAAVDKTQVPLVIWHADCLDGFTSAWVVRRFMKEATVEAEYYAGHYNVPPPDCTGRDVLMVDFSYKRDVIADIHRVARSVLILDHHKSAKEDLKEWIEPSVGFAPVRAPEPGMCRAYFDMSRSGAGLCWDFFFPDEIMPQMVKFVQDRDLWQFNYPETRAICAVLYSHDFDFEVWDEMAIRLETANGRILMASEGIAIMRNATKEREQLIHNNMRILKIGGLLMPTINAPWFHASEIGNAVATSKNNPCGACAVYSDTKYGRRVFSLRSTDAGPDVSAIAVSYGGGGHRNAAGFSMPVGWEGE